MTRTIVALVITAALAMLASPARAQPSEAERAQADALIDAGVALRKQGKEADALARFREAYELDRSARALGQMGLAAKSLRLWVEAERYLEGALAKQEDAWIEENRGALELALDVVRKNLSSLRVEANAPGAKLLIGGREIGDLPLDRALRVPAGATHIEVRAPGYAVQARTETLAAGRETTVRFDLEPERSSPLATPAPVATPRPAAPATRDRGTSDPGATQRTLALVSGGVGVVGLGVGGYFGLRTLALKSDRDEVCPEQSCPTERGVELDQDARDSALISTIGFGVGAAALAGAAVLWFTAPRERESGTAFALGVAPGSVALRGRF